MDAWSIFEKELNKLIENEDNLKAIREMLSKDINNTKEYKLKIDTLLNFSKENNLTRTEAWSYYFLGWYNFDVSEYEKAIKNFMISYNIFEKHNNKFEIAYACNGLTNIYCRMGQYKLSNEWALKGISFCEETGNNEAMIILLLNTCINYIQMEYYDNALDIVEIIEGMNFELTAVQRISYLLSNSEIEINIGNPDVALKIIDEAMEIESANHLNVDISDMLKLKGMAYIKTGKYDLAEEKFKESLEFSIRCDLVYEKCYTMWELSKLYILLEKYEEAIDLLNEILSISSPNKFNHITRGAFNSLYLIYKKLEDTKEALHYLEEYIKIDDEMYDYEQSRLMTKMNLNYTKHIAKQYKQIATYDNLTKFLTKSEILKIGDKVYGEYKVKTIKFSVIMMDLDNFKVVNDTYGHIYGDKAMSLVAETISKCIRNTDYIGRFGGDEFLLICPGAGVNVARDVADRIRRTIEDSLFVLSDDVNARLTLSLGIHECNEEDESAIDVIRKADECLYLAKEKRNSIICIQN